MKIEKLHKDNLLLYASKNYDNPSCLSFSEFEDDVKRLVYLKKLFRKYTIKGELRERLILNHLIVLFNVFGAIPAYRMLFFVIPAEQHSLLKTFLVYMNMVRDDLKQYGIDLIDIPMDTTIIERLRKL